MILGNPITLGGGAKVVSIDVASYEYFDEFPAFIQKYILPTIASNSTMQIVRIYFLNNTTNNRAGIFASFGIWRKKHPSTTDYCAVWRVGASNMGLNYGVNIYAGSTIKIEYYEMSTYQ